jgi:hypothetical protein
MKTIIALTFVSLLQGCALLTAFGLGPKDLVPSLSHCDKVDYERVGQDIKIKAQCRVPAG